MLDFRAEKLASLIGYLRKHVNGEVRFDDTTRRLYSTDASIYQIIPQGVVIPRTEDALVAAVQIALETRTPITARGGGTSLSGQSIGPGLVVDCSKHLNAINDVDMAGRTVRVQPGVVLDQLNRELIQHGLQFGPDVATASRATLGGMIGNNSAGARSIVFGQTVDHVRSLRGILADGTLTEFRELTTAEWEVKAAARTVEGNAYHALERIRIAHADEIDRRYPKILRKVSGYNLLPGNGRWSPRSLAPLIVGSEGTLCVLTEATLRVVPRPKHRGLLVPHFESLRAALDALSACLEFRPSAVELIDSMLIRLAREQRSLRNSMAAIEGTPAALFMVEFADDDPVEVSTRVHGLKRRLREVAGVTAAVVALEPALRDPLWSLRSSAVPLLFGLKGERKPVAFVEDCAVEPAKLPEFVSRFQEILKRHGTDGAYYGHASVGCLHIRPVLNLKNPDDVAQMRQITDEVSSLVLEFGGSMSGEHGDGLLRSEWNRKMFGPVIYDAFRQIKSAFDPQNLLNPGRIVDAPAMTESLRYGDHYKPVSLPVVLDYGNQEGFLPSIELCNGSGVCRKMQGGAMCPSYRATLDERDSTRGRANALRLAITGQGPVADGRSRGKKSALGDPWLFDVMDLCLSCKACKSECPSNVDVAKLKAEWQHAYYLEHRRPIGHRLVANVHRLNRLQSTAAPLVNWLNRRRAARWIMEWLTGIDRRRPLPAVHWNHFRRWFRKRSIAKKAGRRVILFDDCFTTYNEPRIGRAAVEVLEHAGFAVELARPICCGRALISKGYLTRARELVKDQVSELAVRVVDGTPILGLEPSCALTLVDEWPELFPGEETKRVAAAVHLADAWIGEQLTSKSIKVSWQPLPGKCLFHGHCHQRALVGVNGSATALRQVPGLDVDVLDAGCCGMAGAFGYEADHFDLSVRIAGLALLPAIEKEKEAIVVAMGTSCRHQIRDLSGCEAFHPIELIRKALPSP